MAKLRDVCNNSRAEAFLLRYCISRTPAPASSCAQSCAEIGSKVASSITYSLGSTSRIDRLFPIRTEQALDEMGIEFAGGEVGIRKDTPLQRNGGLDAFDDEHVQGAPHPGDGFGAVAALNDQLGDHGIVVGRDYGIGVGRGIDTHSRTSRRLKSRDASGRRHERYRIFRVYAAFDGMAGEIIFADGVVEASHRRPCESAL